MRLISEDDVFMVLSMYYHHRTVTQADALHEALEMVPEAVVRCDSCRWHYYRGNDIVCGNSGDVVQADDYCSYGESRTDEA